VNRRILAGMVGVAGLFLPAAASADDATGWYVGAGAGLSQATDYCDPNAGAVIVTCDDTGTAWRLLLGYQINRYFGVEGGYLNLGQFNSTVTQAGVPTTNQTKIHAGYLEGLAILPIGERFGLYAKAGVAYWTFQAHDTVGGAGVPDQTQNGWDFVGGVGAQFFFTKNLALRAEYELIPKLGNSETGELDVQVISASVLWKF
jgi:OOP family OmpA-OmpF porin